MVHGSTGPQVHWAFDGTFTKFDVYVRLLAAAEAAAVVVVIALMVDDRRLGVT